METLGRKRTKIDAEVDFPWDTRSQAGVKEAEFKLNAKRKAGSIFDDSNPDKPPVKRRDVTGESILPVYIEGMQISVGDQETQCIECRGYKWAVSAHRIRVR